MYRLQTERKNVRRIKSILLGLGLDFTIQYGDGSFQLRKERSITIELDGTTRRMARKAALAIKALNRQQCVLLQQIATANEFV
jgi:hypothetical protein